MKMLNTLSLAIALLIVGHATQAQDLEGLRPLPTTKEEFIKSEPSVISVIDWLENNALGKESDKRTALNAVFMAWLTNAPTVTVELNSNVAPLSKKNPDLLMVFMGGWTRYALQNNYSKDPVKCNLAGIRSVLHTYKLGEGAKKDKNIDKLVELDEKNELEAWVTTQLSKK